MEEERVRTRGVSYQTLWIDEIRGNSFQVFLLDPRPSDVPPGHVGLLIEIMEGLVDVDRSAPILIESIEYLQGSSDFGSIQRADYIDRQTTVANVAGLVRARQRCTETDQYRCSVTLRHSAYHHADDQLHIRSGNYVVFVVLPAPYHGFEQGQSFLGAHMFFQEAYQLSRNSEDSTIMVSTHGVGHNGMSYGPRSFVLHNRFQTDTSIIWQLVTNLWCDLFTPDQVRVIHSPTPPQIASDDAINLIVAERIALARMPILVSRFGTSINMVLPHLLTLEFRHCSLYNQPLGVSYMQRYLTIQIYRCLRIKDPYGARMDTTA